MRVAQMKEYGGTEVIEIVDAPRPAVDDGKVLVEVHAASLNPFDTKLRQGVMRQMIPLQMPMTLGGDMAGTVTEIGNNVQHVVVGDKVYGQSIVVGGGSGAFAEYALMDADRVAKAPTTTGFIEAAALPLVGVSALQAITEHINLQSGQKIFIHGGAGGIGSAAIQIAKHLGAYVAATAAPDDIAYVAGLGADQVIDYTAQDYAAELQDFDAVFDTVGDDFTHSFQILKEGGMAVTMVAEVDEAAVAEKKVTALRQGTEVTTERLERLRELVEAHIVTPRIGQVFPLAEVADAFTARESGTVKGKIVLAIKE